jgi:hypothetical protein
MSSGDISKLLEHEEKFSDVIDKTCKYLVLVVTGTGFKSVKMALSMLELYRVFHKNLNNFS